MGCRATGGGRVGVTAAELHSTTTCDACSRSTKKRLRAVWMNGMQVAPTAAGAAESSSCVCAYEVRRSR